MSCFAAVKVIMITIISPVIMITIISPLINSLINIYSLLDDPIGGHDFFLDGQNYNVPISQKCNEHQNIICFLITWQHATK